jgi:hypothetical protein
MATSGTFVFNPELAELMDEAFERARVDPAHLTARHIRSARRSISFMLVDWATKDYHDFRITQESFTVVEGQAVYTAGTDFDTTYINLLDVLDASLTRSGTDTPVEFTSRSSYMDIPDKTTEGRPDRVFVDKQRDGLVFTLWPVPENSTDILKFNAVRKYEDSDTAADNADVPYHMYDAFAAELAFRLAEKYSPPELESALYQKAQVKFRDAQNAVRERGDVRIIPTASRRTRGSAGRYR